jgi:hypothetical protein
MFTIARQNGVKRAASIVRRKMMIKKRLVITLAVAALVAVPLQPGPAAAGASSQLQAIGTWDGVTQKAKLEGAYTDAFEQEIPFGIRSYFQAPWRSYMDTWDGSRFLDTLGVVFNVKREEAEAAAAMMEEAGIRSARMEISWDSLDYQDDTAFKTSNREHVRTLLTALKRHNIRPLILLNMNSGMPNPNADVKVTMTKKAEQGAREIYVDNPSEIKPHYTGLRGMGPAMFPIITEVDMATGKCVLSAPLPKEVPQGAFNLVKLKYQPFSGPVFADGTPNPASQETLNGWMNYIRAVTNAVREDLGTAGASDAGFDIEVYNEYTFGYHYLNINHYYEPDLGFAAEMSFSKNGKTVNGIEALLPITADYAANPANGLPGVRVISGFSNQRPFDSGSGMWSDQTGFSRHYYTGYDPVKSMITPDSGSVYTVASKLYSNALGSLDSTRRPDNFDQSVPGSYYIPSHVSAFPEEWSYAYATEMMIRDMEPFPGPWLNHFRYSSPGSGQMPELWMTESNFYRAPWAKKLMAAAKVTNKDPQLAGLMHASGAKALARMFTFYAHKGVQTITAYAIRNEDTNFGILPEAFFEELKKNNYVLTDTVRAKAGPQLNVLKNIASLMTTGQKIEAPRPLQVSGLTEYKPRLVYAGDGTEEHPDRFHRDDFAVLPYQLAGNKFAIGYYVVTRNITHEWNEDKPLLDPSRYNMPEQSFELTLSNIYGEGASVSAYDPMTGKSVPVQIMRADSSTITVLVQSVDYPRFLMVEEAVQGPVIGSPVLQKTADGAELRFFSSVNGVTEVTYGEYPVRSGGSFKEESYSDTKFQNPVSENQVQSLSKQLGTAPGAWKWTGTFVPKFTEAYTFTAYSDNMNDTKLKINGQEISVKGPKGADTIQLTAGMPYDLELSYLNRYTGTHYAMLFWSSPSQERALVPAAVPAEKVITFPVAAGQQVALPIAGLKNGEGVKVKLTSEQGITSRFPFWDYDGKAVLYEGTAYAPTGIPDQGNGEGSGPTGGSPGSGGVSSGGSGQSNPGGVSNEDAAASDEPLGVVAIEPLTPAPSAPAASSGGQAPVAAVGGAGNLVNGGGAGSIASGGGAAAATGPASPKPVLVKASGLSEGEAVSVPAYAAAIENKIPTTTSTGGHSYQAGATFQDIVSHWARNDIELLAAKGYVAGYGASSFMPDKQVSRAEFTSMLMRMLMEPKDAIPVELPFTDVHAGDWYYREVAYGYRKGYVQGTGPDLFNGQAVVTREEMTAISVRVLEKEAASLNAKEQQLLLEQWKDHGLVSAWARETTAKASKLGLLAGDEAGYIHPKGTATRAEAAAVLARLMKHLENKQ